MRTIWNGSINFGLVNIPIGLAVAQQRKDTAFRTLHRECGTPIKQKRWCPTHDREVGPDELVKGWEVAKGQFVLVEDADLEALERTDDSRSIEITQFVRLEEVDPIFFDRTYFLVPGQAPAQRRPYVLLLQAMQETGAAALGRFVRSGRESLCLVRARGDALALELPTGGLADVLELDAAPCPSTPSAARCRRLESAARVAGSVLRGPAATHRARPAPERGRPSRPGTPRRTATPAGSARSTAPCS